MSTKNELIENAEKEIHSIKEEYEAYCTAIEQYAGDDPYVLGELLAKASALEAKLRHKIAFVIRRYGYRKEHFRQMLVGYYQADYMTIQTKSGSVKIHRNDIPAVKELLTSDIAICDFNDQYSLRAEEIAGGELRADISEGILKHGIFVPPLSPMVSGKCNLKKFREEKEKD